MFTIDENKIFAVARKHGIKLPEIPKPNDYSFANEVNNDDISMEVIKAVLKFEGKCVEDLDILDFELLMPRAYRDYIIYLCDVIGFMEIALKAVDKYADRLFKGSSFYQEVRLNDER